MLGHWARSVMLAGLISGLCAPAGANATPASPSYETASGAISLDGMQLAQTDLTLENLSEQSIGTAIAEPVMSPAVMPIAPPTRIGLLLPTRSQAMQQVADAVRAGFMAAWQHEPSNLVVNLVETGDAPQDVLAAYQNAAAANDIVVGPLTRSGLAAMAQAQVIGKPTIALVQLDAGEPDALASANLLAVGLSVEDEARQIAASVGNGRSNLKAIAVSTSAPWQRRAAAAFVATWRHMGLNATAIEIPLTNGFMAPNTLLELRNRFQAERPALLFAALDASQAIQLRLGVGGEITTYGISQLNPYSLAGWQTADRLLDLEGVQLLDMPWQLQADHPAVMAYPHLPQTEQRRSPDIERLYALGIDAYRIAHNVAMRQTDFTLDGVTGRLAVQFGGGTPRFQRVLQPAVYREGMVQPTGQQ